MRSVVRKEFQKRDLRQLLDNERVAQTVVDTGAARRVENGALFNQIAKFAHFALELGRNFFGGGGGGDELFFRFYVFQISVTTTIDFMHLVFCTFEFV